MCGAFVNTLGARAMARAAVPRLGETYEAAMQPGRGAMVRYWLLSPAPWSATLDISSLSWVAQQLSTFPVTPL